MGYTGKQVIHPDQVPVVRQAFSPSPERIEWATGLIEAFCEHQKSGKVNKEQPAFFLLRTLCVFQSACIYTCMESTCVKLMLKRLNCGNVCVQYMVECDFMTILLTVGFTL